MSESRCRRPRRWTAALVLIAVSQLALGWVGHTHAARPGRGSAVAARAADPQRGASAPAADACPICSLLATCAALVAGGLPAVLVEHRLEGLRRPEAPPSRSARLWASAASRAPPSARL